MCSCARLVVGDVVVDPNTGAVTAVGMGIVPLILMWWGVQCDWVREHGAIYIGNEVPRWGRPPSGTPGEMRA